MNGTDPLHKPKLKLAVLISGRGSNLQALINACHTPDFPAEIVGVVSDNPNALGLKRAFDAGIPAMIVDKAAFKGLPKQQFEQALLETLSPWGADIICLAGFMRLLSADFIAAVQGQIINIHPSLLPKHKGLNTHQAVLATKDQTTGCTVHWVVPDMDAGPIIVQKTVPVFETDTVETLENRVLQAEHTAYPEAIRQLAERKNTLSDNRFTANRARDEIERATRMWDIFSTASLYAVVGIAALLGFMAFTLT